MVVSFLTCSKNIRPYILSQENLSSESAFVRSTVVTALKYTISDQPQPIDALLHSCIAEFLSTIGDPDLVRGEGVNISH